MHHLEIQSNQSPVNNQKEYCDQQMSTSKVGIPFKDIKKFSGKDTDESINDFLFRFQHISRLNKYTESDKLNILPILLEGSALSVYKNLTPRQLESSEEILNSLVQRFNPLSLRQSKKMQVYLTKMKDEDDLEHFIQELLKEAKNCELQEREIMDIFINNVSPRIKHTLIMQQPTTLSAALSIARLKQVADDTCPKKSKAVTQPMIGEIHRKLDALMNMSQNDELNPSKTLPIKAYSNHNQINQLEDITNEKFSSEMDTISENFNFINYENQVECYKCNELGHYSYECPRKVDALFTERNANNANNESFRSQGYPDKYYAEQELNYNQEMYENDFDLSCDKSCNDNEY